MPLRSPIRIGILGGSFDPVHIGHLIVAEHVAEQLKLDRVLLIPCCVPPHKPSAAQAPGRDRLAMVRLAIRGNRRFMTSDCELRRGGVSYSVDTLEALRGAYGPTAKLFLVIGADSLEEFGTWRDCRTILKLCTVVTACRPGIEGSRSGLAGFTSRERGILRRGMLTTPLIDVSSTEIRRRCREGRGIRYLVPEAVQRYIERKGVYARKQ